MSTLGKCDPNGLTHTQGRTWSPLTDETTPYSSRELAAILQSQFDEENRLLLAERAGLAAAAQHVFDCAVCMDTLPEESIARIDPCGHPFCRDCVRGLIESQIESRRFPVMCPACTAEPGNNSESIGSRCCYRPSLLGGLWLIRFSVGRGYAGAGTRHWHNGRAIRNMGRNGDGRVPY